MPLAQASSLLFTRDRGLFVTTRHCWCLQNTALKLVCVKTALSERPQRPQSSPCRRWTWCSRCASSPRPSRCALVLRTLCLADVVGVEFMDGQHRRVVDAFGYSLSAYIGKGTRRTTSHDIIVRRLESLMHFGGQNCVERERKGVFSGCIADHGCREAYMQAERKRQHTRAGTHVVSARFDPQNAGGYLGAEQAPSKLQLWLVSRVLADVRGEQPHQTRGRRLSRVPPTLQRLLAAKADVPWNRSPPGSDGPFQRYLASAFWIAATEAPLPVLSKRANARGPSRVVVEDAAQSFRPVELFWFQESASFQEDWLCLRPLITPGMTLTKLLPLRGIDRWSALRRHRADATPRGARRVDGVGGWRGRSQI